jgi:transposase
MHLKSILNRVEPLKSFVYREQRLVECPGVQPFLEVHVETRANGRTICSGCGKKRPGYDRLATGRFKVVPLWNMAVFCVYAMRRVDCPTCGVTVGRVPRGDGKGHLTKSYLWFPARWAKRLSWTETVVAFNTTWENVFRSVKHAVLWGVAHRDLSGIESIGVDEIQCRSGHTYLALVYQITGVKRLLWVSHERTEQSLRKFFEVLTDDGRTGIRFVCSDMWKPYLNVIAEQIPQVLHVLDPFHIMRNMNVAINDVRRQEVAQWRWVGGREAEELTDRAAVGAPPGDQAMRLESLEVAHEQHAEEDARRNAPPTQKSPRNAGHTASRRTHRSRSLQAGCSEPRRTNGRETSAGRKPLQKPPTAAPGVASQVPCFPPWPPTLIGSGPMAEV